MDFFSEPQVVIMQNSILFAHLTAYAILTTVHLKIRGKDLKAVPGDTVPALDNFTGFLALERGHFHEVFLLCVEHIAHEEHLVAVILENHNDEEEN